MSIVMAGKSERRLKLSNEAVLIKVAMGEEGFKGDPRDYVIVHGSEIVTAFGRYTVTSRLDGREVDPTNVEGDGAVDPRLERKVVHRSNLWRYVGRAESRAFWKFGRRTRK